jgi:hypothetical protein
VVVRNASPSFSACFSVTLQAAAGERIAEAVPPKPRLLSWRQDGQRLQIEVALQGADGRALAAEGDMQALLYAVGGAWQRRTPMRADADGRWTAALELPAGVDASEAELLVQSARHGLAFTRGRIGPLVGDARRDAEREHAQR